MPDDYVSHRRFHVYAVAGEGAGADDPGALTDQEAEKTVVAYVWPEFTEVRLFPRDDFEHYATPFEHAFSSLVARPIAGPTGELIPGGNHPGHGAAPIVDQTGEVIMYVGWFDYTKFRMPSDMVDAFHASDDWQVFGVYALSEQWRGEIFISADEKPGAGLSDPMEVPEMAYLAVTTADGTVLQFLDKGDTIGNMSTFQPIDLLAGWIAGLLRKLGVAVLDYFLAEDTIVELGTGRLVGSVSHDEMIFHLNRIEANGPELLRLRAAQALNGNPLQQEMRGIWKTWAEQGRQVQYLSTKGMVAQGVEAQNLITLRAFGGNPRGLALINDMLLDPGFERQFFEETVHEMVADALGWSGSGGEAEMAFVGAEYNRWTNTAQVLLETSIKLGRSIEDVVNALR